MPTSDSAGDAGPVARTVVIIDDDAAVSASLRFALEEEGLSVRAYLSAAPLLAEIDPPTTGCLVLDYRLPDGDGLELLQTLREMGVTAPAILITTHPGLALQMRAQAVGVTIVEKPLLNTALLEAIRGCLERFA